MRANPQAAGPSREGVDFCRILCYLISAGLAGITAAFLASERGSDGGCRGRRMAYHLRKRGRGASLNPGSRERGCWASCPRTQLLTVALVCRPPKSRANAGAGSN